VVYLSHRIFLLKGITQVATLKFWNMTIETEQGESAIFDDAVVYLYYIVTYFDSNMWDNLTVALPVPCFSAGEAKDALGHRDYAILSDGTFIQLQGIRKVYNNYATWYRDDHVPTFHYPENNPVYTGVTRKL
jgi:hypothetical protein